MDFQSKVIERSKVIPVLVDFWAEWCGPCRVLGPILDAMAEKAEGKWELVKVDVDNNRELSMEYRIQGIPAVKLFIDGKEVDGFTGALPEYQIQAFLEKNIPSNKVKRLRALKTKLKESPEHVKEELEDMMAEEDSKEVRLLLAELLLYQDPSRSIELVADFRDGDEGFEKALDIRAIAELSLELWEGESPAKPYLEEASMALKDKNDRKVFENLLDAIIRDKPFANELARRACIAMFHRLGEDHPLSKEFRPRFNMALY